MDVRASTHIERPREEVAAYATDPENDPVRISGISEARMITQRPPGLGAQVERVAHFLGRRIEYVLEIVELDPGRVMAMRSVRGPFPMLVTYSFEDSGGGTRTSVRVQGDAGGFYRIAGPVLAASVRRSITKDVRRLKELLESEGRSSS